MGQGGLKVLHLWCDSQKIRYPKPKNFFHYKLDDLPSFLSVWTAALYSSAFGAGAMLARPHAIRMFSRKPLELTRLRRCFRQWCTQAIYSHIMLNISKHYLGRNGDHLPIVCIAFAPQWMKLLGNLTIWHRVLDWCLAGSFGHFHNCF